MRLSLLISVLFSASLLQAQTFINDTAYFDGVERNWFVYEPTAFDASVASPLVINLHGAGSSAFEQAIYSQFNFVADTAGPLVVYPNAIENFWNSGFDSISAFLPDDVAFLTALIDTLKTQYNIDDNRVYTMGMSNGGFMSYRLVCETANVFAAMASVTGSMTNSVFDGCNPADGPVPVLQMHGTSDNTVLYDGSEEVKGIEDIVEFWADFNNCPAVQISDLPDLTIDATTIELQRYYFCDDFSEVIFYKIENGGHTWPGSFPLPGIGNTNQDINAEVEIWEFFKRHSLDMEFTSVSHPEVIEMQLVPNPFTEQFVLIAAGEFDVKISDLSGRLVYQGQGTDQLIVTPEFGTGMYLVEVQSAVERKVITIVRN
ncbi:MAG: polyhydroxybutyrate depolymerase [Limisphaerales bacterium]|jgi:polyhydroxybutyrate depolymerase